MRIVKEDKVSSLAVPIKTITILMYGKALAYSPRPLNSLEGKASRRVRNHKKACQHVVSQILQTSGDDVDRARFARLARLNRLSPTWSRLSEDP